MNTQDLIHNFVEVAVYNGTDNAKKWLKQRKDFISVSDEELDQAISGFIAEVMNDGGAKWFYLLIIAMGVASGVLGVAVVVSPSRPDQLRLIMCGIVGISAVLIRQYSIYLLEPFKRANLISEICEELKLELRSGS